jgi:hypothetical protein
LAGVDASRAEGDEPVDLRLFVTISRWSQVEVPGVCDGLGAADAARDELVMTWAAGSRPLIDVIREDQGGVTGGRKGVRMNIGGTGTMVTSDASGLGLATARRLGAAGADVKIFDLTPTLQRLPREGQASLGKQAPHRRQLGDPSEYAAFVQHVIENSRLDGEVVRARRRIWVGAPTRARRNRSAREASPGRGQGRRYRPHRSAMPA